jgi:hypothetical protein
VAEETVYEPAEEPEKDKPPKYPSDEQKKLKATKRMRHKLKKRWIKKYLRMNQWKPRARLREEPKKAKDSEVENAALPTDSLEEEINTEKTAFEVTDTDISVLFSQTHSEQGEFQFIRSGRRFDARS